MDLRVAVRPAEAPAAGRRRKSVARRPSSHRAAADESVCSEGGSENPFNDKALIRRLLDGCILSDVVERIDRADPEQRAWDTLGSFLEIGHQLFAYVEASGRMRRDLLRAEERCQDEVARLQAKTAEVAALREALERERQDREEERRVQEEERRIKILNPMGRGCPDFLMERDVPLSRPIPILGTESVSRRHDWDAGMLGDDPVSTHEMISRPDVPRDVPLGSESLTSVL
ncbi:uncharacterized protein [Elaeis guineensis]|uniref:uncharacterized protein n=1 Tax=Elaeis guineensis var. tenera TaxID=51953 RepID=UPI003C6CE113